ncbi:hypothetical protein BWZ20_11330 [Winogradskyella sp. J14-2]|uniref:DUF3857 domain-containing protein n=1 Tax=Winogradskyella sp. J14-2 TaxID=1936080 RepID=UPI000972A855|nr:DUF3857 domain-containing protein [Winogradskyella sp. J14-2]APY08856.1 hypothetical protein BWZ20_11330 [Winogradskyella sp. J14-2]
MKYVFAAIHVLIVIACYSQPKDLYKSNTIPTDLKTKANAVIRYENKTVEVINTSEIKVISKRIVTVLNKYGNRHVDAVQFYDDNTEIVSISASIYDAYGDLIKNIKERDFKDNSAVSDFSIYEDDRVKHLDYNPIDYPYSVEYQSEVIYRNTAFFPDWRPINDFFLSIEHSEYKIINTGNVELKTKQENFESFPITEEKQHHYILKNFNGIEYESYTPALFRITPRYKVTLRSFNMIGVEGVNNNWQEFGKWMYDKLLTGTGDIPQSTLDEVRALTNGVTNKIERAKLVYQYMQDKTRYISIQVGIGGWKPMKALDVDNLGYSDCKGLTNYTKSLLDAVDVPSYYTVVYGGKDIRSIDKEFSSIQGNHVILCVPNEQEPIFLECTSQTNPFGFIAGFTDDRDVLLVKPNGGEIIHTKIYSQDESVQFTKADIILDGNGNIEADVSIKTTGYQYSIHQGLEREEPREQQLYYKNYWDYINNLSVSDIQLVNDKSSVVYNENIKLTAKNYASVTGERLIVQPNIFNRLNSIPVRYTNRKLDFTINRAFKDVDEYIIKLPSGYKIEAMSEGSIIENKFGNYQISLTEIEGNKIKYTRVYTQFKGTYDKEEYKAFRDFRKQIVKNDKSKIALIKL